MSEEEERRRKMIIDGEVARLAVDNIVRISAGELTIEQVREMTAIDQEWLRKTRACMDRGD